MRKSFLTLVILLAGMWNAYGSSLDNNFSFNEGDRKLGEQYLRSQKIAFEENKGQITGEEAHRVKYTFKDKGLKIFLLNNGIAYQFCKTHYHEGFVYFDKFAQFEGLEKVNALRKDVRIETYRMDVTLVGSNPNPQITAEGKSKDYTQYYNHDALQVHNYTKITYHNVYANIDWVIYCKNGSVKYDFVVHPGGNPSQIILQTNWVEDLILNKDGSLTLRNNMGSITELTPVSFQGDKVLKTKFNIESNQITFAVNNFSPSQTLIIDPNLQWATYYGESDYDYGLGCSVDISGNVYLAGWTPSSSFIALGGHQNIYGGGVYDAFLVKFDNNGVRQWGTYYGGSDSDVGYSCASDVYGNVYLAGSTSSSSSIASYGHQNSYGGGGFDAFLVKFNSNGIRQWGTYYGGSGFEEGWSCAVDVYGSVYLVGNTSSTSSIASGGHQNIYGGGVYDAFLVKFNSNGVRQWGTYYGGDGVDYSYSCAADHFGDVFLAGHTTSISTIASGGHQNTGGGENWDAFLVKFNGSGVRQWGTYYGGNGSENGRNCAVDESGNVYLAGSTTSNTNISSGGHQDTVGGGNWDAFLVKFNSSGIRQWGTYYGGSGLENGRSCAVDANGNVYLVGMTSSMSSIAHAGYQDTYGGGDLDAFLVKFSSSGVRQWASYYGGIGNDYGEFCAVDGYGNLYLAGSTTSSSSIASGGHQNTFGGGLDAFLVKFYGGNSLSFNNAYDINGLITLYPNPTQGSFTITIKDDAERELQIFDSFGRLVLQAKINNQKKQIDLPNLADGIYQVRIGGGVAYTLKLLIVNN